MSADVIPESATGQQQESNGFKNTVALIVTVLLLAGFGYFILYLARQAGSLEEIAWQRQVFLFSGVEAIVFAAVGWLFGREVNRKQAQMAEARAESSEAKATEAAEVAADVTARAESVKAAIKARERTYADESQVATRGFVEKAKDAARTDIRELSEFVDLVFPD